MTVGVDSYHPSVFSRETSASKESSALVVEEGILTSTGGSSSCCKAEMYARDLLEMIAAASAGLAGIFLNAASFSSCQITSRVATDCKRNACAISGDLSVPSVSSIHFNNVDVLQGVYRHRNRHHGPKSAAK